MGQCQTELKLFIQAIKSLQLAVDLEPKHAVKKLYLCRVLIVIYRAQTHRKNTIKTIKSSCKIPMISKHTFFSILKRGQKRIQY